MKAYLFLCALLLTTTIWAQPSNPDAPAPLDGGISLLIAAGAGLGAKKVYDKKKASA